MVNEIDDSVLLSDAEIAKLHGTFNGDIALHAWGDAEKALQSALDIEKNLNEKAFSFLKFLSPAITIFLGYILVNFSTFLLVLDSFGVWQKLLTLGGILLIFLSIFLFMFAVARGKEYGKLGRYPDTWLRKGVINGDEDDYITNLIYILKYMQKAIAISNKNNEAKQQMMQWAIISMFGGFTSLGFLLIQEIVKRLF